MAASPVSISRLPFPSSAPPLALTQRRLEANRRNAARSTGPRTAEGKARVARNPIKHGFFAGPERWTPDSSSRDFEETLDGLREEFKPQGTLEESCVATIAESYVRMAAMLRYENIAALKYHQQCERELNERIAAADAAEAARLRGAAREPAPRRTMAADDPRSARSEGDHPLLGAPRPGDSPRSIGAGGLGRRSGFGGSIVKLESAKTNPLRGTAEKWS